MQIKNKIQFRKRGVLFPGSRGQAAGRRSQVHSGFTLLEMLLALALLLTLTQLILSFHSIIIRTAHHSMTVILKQIEVENLRELQNANSGGASCAQLVAGK